MQHNVLAPGQTPPFVPANSAQSAPVGRPVPSPAKPGGLGNVLANVAGGFMKGFAPEQYQAGVDRRNENALAEAMKAGDYGAASNSLYDLGDIQGGMQVADYGRNQQAGKAAAQDEQKQKQLQGMQVFIQNMQSVPEANRARYAMDNWGSLEDVVGMDFMTFWQQSGGDVSDQSLQEDLTAINTQLGIGPQAGDAYTLAPGAVRYGADGTEISSNPKPVTPAGPQSALGKVQADFQAGLITQQQAEAQIAKLNAPRSGGVNMQFGENGSLSGLSIGGDGGKGKTSAVVRGVDGDLIVSPSQQQTLYNKSFSGLQSYEATNTLVTEDIDRAIAMASGWTTGIGGAVFDGIPGTPAFNLNKVLDSVKANIGFDKLQDMRDNSPTGGALGQVSTWELELLQSVLGSLEQAQSKEQFVFNLNRIKNIKAEGARRRRAAFAQDFPSLQEFGGFVGDAAGQIDDLSQASDDDLLSTLGLN